MALRPTAHRCVAGGPSPNHRPKQASAIGIRQSPVLIAGFLLSATLAGIVPARADERPLFCPGHEGDERQQIIGTGGDDLLRVPEGAVGCGLGGDDVLRADRHGNTSLWGGEGDDVFCAQNRDPDRIDGGDGDDRAMSDEDEDVIFDVESDVVLFACDRMP